MSPDHLPDACHAMLTATTGFGLDPSLPARDLMLDEQFVAQHLNEPGLLPPALGPVLTATRVRTKYRIGESLRTVHRIRTDQATMTVSSRMFGQSQSVATMLQRGTRAIDDSMLNTVWWIFPDDRRLRNLNLLIAADPETAHHLDLPGWHHTEVAEYAPERSVTVKAEDRDGKPVAYIKAYAPRAVDTRALASRYTTVSTWLMDRAAMSSPEVLGVTDGLLALQPMPGRTWADGRDTAGATVLHRLGQAIACLHLMPTDRIPLDMGAFARLLPRRVLHGAELIAAARPDVRAQADAVSTCLARQAPEGPAVFLHGDCHPKNAIVNMSSVALIDLDQAGVGDASCDIASLLARLLHDVLLGQQRHGQAMDLAQAFLSGYARVRPLPDHERLCWHLAAALVAERALRSVNRVNVQALPVLEATLALAVDVSTRWPFPDPEV